MESGAWYERTPYYGQKYAIPDDELAPPHTPYGSIHYREAYMVVSARQ